MAYPIEFIAQLQGFRKKGYSIKELARKFKISPDTASRWVRKIKLNDSALHRIQKLRTLGQHKARNTLLKRGLDLNKELRIKAKSTIKNLSLNKDTIKLCCALLYWCEGNKDPQYIRFTSSDPSLIQLFLSLLRNGFDIDERKFRALIHLHGYHNESRQRNYWHKHTHIPFTQFYNSYLKPHTGKRKHDDYAGCLAISYYDHKVAKELHAIYNAFATRGVGQWQA